MEWKTFDCLSKHHRFPYENTAISEGNSTILPLGRKCKTTFFPLKTDDVSV